MTSLPLRVGVDQIRFDPSDDATQKFRPSTIVYQVYLDTEYYGAIDADAASVDL